ncbi:MAG: GntR family transcriptional regulator [Acidobacteriota bacterium]
MNATQDTGQDGKGVLALVVHSESSRKKSESRVNRDDPVPLYHQLYRILLEKITLGVWKPGDLIPSEKDLGEQFHLSRITIRQTLHQLAADGYLSRQQGRGTFVSQPRIQHGPEGAFGLTGYLRAHGYAAGWRLLSMEKVMPPEKVQSILKLEDDQPVLMIRRFRLADEDVIGLHRVYVPFPLAEGVKPEYLNQGESSLHYMEECMGLALSHSHRSVSAIPASEREANLLSVSVGYPLLQIERTTIGMDDMPVEYLRAVYRGDRFEYYLRLEHAGRGQRRPATLL